MESFGKMEVRPAHVASGVIRVSSSHSQSKRLWEIYRKLDEIVREFSPAVMVVESLFHANNSQSLIKLSQVRGVILLLGETHSMDIFEVQSHGDQARAYRLWQSRKSSNDVYGRESARLADPQVSRPGRRSGNGHLPFSYIFT